MQIQNIFWIESRHVVGKFYITDMGKLVSLPYTFEKNLEILEIKF